MASSTKLLKLLLLTAILTAAVVGGWMGLIAWQHRGLVKITVKAIPEDSQIQLDGKKVNGGILYVKPGDHTLSASRTYFSAVTKQINTHNLQSSQVIYLLPFPSSQQALDYLTAHPDIQREREEQAAIDVNNTQTELMNKYPILTKLPVYNADYRIDYSIDATNTLSFSITLYPIVNGPGQSNAYQQQLKQYKDEALGFLRDNNINPQDFTITYSPDTAANL